MSFKVKLTAYAVLLLLCAGFAWGFYSNYSTVLAADEDLNPDIATIGTGSATNNPSDTNAPAQTTVAQPTNSAAGDTNAVVAPAPNAPTNTASAAAKAQSRHRHHVRLHVTPREVGAARSGMITYLAMLVLALVGLAVLFTLDVTHFVGSQAIDFLFDDVGEAPQDPEYERAEAEWANGNFLEAIEIMREFLKKNPRHLHAALRIAEIYEKDLKSHLAAALEYEEILKHRMPPERWGWTAIHLCNLHFRLNQPAKAQELLHRIADDYPKTKAAKKARARLGLPEPEEEEEVAVPEDDAEAENEEHPVIHMEEHPPELEPRAETPPPPEPPKPPPPSKSTLPPGFRRKE
jgi:TolA-binding protein